MKIDIGCGANKKEGFIGVDIAPMDGVDYVIDMERDPLPFDDNSVDYVFSNHAFEHITAPQNILRELIRVCKPNAVLEIWTPYLKSNDAFLLGHYSFYNENIWRHICYLYDGFYFGDANGRLSLDRFQYILFPNIEHSLQTMNIPFSFALEHMFNIALEFSAYMHVIKPCKNAPKDQKPSIYVSYARNEPFRAI